MKTIFKYFALLILTSLIINSCRPKKFSDIGDPSSKLEGIKANWMLAHAYVIDEAYVSPDKLEITDFYKTAANLPNLNIAENTFTSNISGVIKNYFGTGSGSWKFDNNDFPSMVIFNYSNATIDTFLLASTIRTTDSVLKLKKQYYYFKNGKKNLGFSYIWEFKK